MKRLGVALATAALFCSPLLAERVVKVEALSTDTATFRQNRFQISMADLAVQLAPFRPVVDLTPYVLLAGDADGQVIQGRAGANAARVDIGEAVDTIVQLRGAGATPGYVQAVGNGAYLSSGDEATYLDLYDGNIDFETDGVFSLLAPVVRINSVQTPPTNANDACTAGDTIDTATFHYFCAATDTWVRVAMATW